MQFGVGERFVRTCWYTLTVHRGLVYIYSATPARHRASVGTQRPLLFKLGNCRIVTLHQSRAWNASPALADTPTPGRIPAAVACSSSSIQQTRSFPRSAPRGTDDRHGRLSVSRAGGARHRSSTDAESGDDQSRNRHDRWRRRRRCQIKVIIVRLQFRPRICSTGARGERGTRQSVPACMQSAITHADHGTAHVRPSTNSAQYKVDTTVRRGTPHATATKITVYTTDGRQVHGQAVHKEATSSRDSGLGTREGTATRRVSGGMV